MNSFCLGSLLTVLREDAACTVDEVQLLSFGLFAPSNVW